MSAGATGTVAEPPQQVCPADLADTWSGCPAVQQPQWPDEAHAATVREELADLPGLLSAAEVGELQPLLAEVAAGRVQVIQAGDCAEDPAECTTADVTRKAAMIGVLADVLQMSGGRPVLRVGRVAGQFAKPRSKPTEIVDGVELPVFRGHLVNDPRPDADGRVHDPARLLAGYRAAQRAVGTIREHNAAGPALAGPPLWTSHEALVLDYEVPLLRTDPELGPYLSSTHWPWIGDRTRQLDGAHVALLSAVANPVACKVGPRMSPADLLELCERLDPDRVPGRLTLITRMGVDRVPGVTRLVAAVRAAGHPAIWLCDPMHGNTVALADGRKTRFVGAMVREVRGFQAAVRAGGGVPAGLHLEVTPDAVQECVSDHGAATNTARRYTSLCDPRLNLEQAVAVVSQWSGEGGAPA